MARKNPGVSRKETEELANHKSLAYADKVLDKEQRESMLRGVYPPVVANAVGLAGLNAIMKNPAARGMGKASYRAGQIGTLAGLVANSKPLSELNKARHSIADTYPKIQEAKAKNAALRKRKEK